MSWRLAGIVVLIYATPAFAGIACFEKATDKLLEYQQPGSAGMCERNFVTNNPQYGYTAAEIEERVVTEQEWQSLRATWIEAPSQAAHAARQQQRANSRAALQSKLGLSPQDWDTLQQALTP